MLSLQTPINPGIYYKVPYLIDLRVRVIVAKALELSTEVPRSAFQPATNCGWNCDMSSINDEKAAGKWIVSLGTIRGQWASSSSRADFQYRSTSFAPWISLLSPPKALIDRADQTEADDKILLGGIHAPTSVLRNYVGKREDGENPVNGDWKEGASSR